MVKAGGEPAVEVALVSSHATQPPCSPERSLPFISRPKAKWLGTPFSERGRGELKRAGLETISGVSRIKKKMVFEMAEELLGGKNGGGTALPEGEQHMDGIMLKKLAHMARPGPFEAATGHLLLLDHEQSFAAGISDDDLVDPPTNSRFWEVGELKESASNMEEQLKKINDIQGDLTVRSASEQREADIEFSGIGNVEWHNGQLPRGGTMELTSLAGTTQTTAGNNLEASVLSPTKKHGQQQLVETNLHAWPTLAIVEKGWADHMEASGCLGPCACDILKENDSHQPLGVHACASTTTSKDNNHAKLASSHNSLPPKNDGEQSGLVGEAAPEVGADEHPPEIRSPPATVQQQVGEKLGGGHPKLMKKGRWPAERTTIGTKALIRKMNQ